jgi:tetratricopeptide (TPR) repeat protein
VPRTAAPSHRLISALLELYRVSSGNGAERTPARLRAILRRYPFWLAGHLDLARISLVEGDVATAYASAQAARVLAASNSQRSAEALHLLGQCFLARGEHASALSLFQQAQPQLGSTPKFSEDMAAALMLAGSYREAALLLEAVPPTSLSAQGKAALEYSRIRG